MNLRKIILATALVGLAGTSIGMRAWKAHRNLVTLDVENVPVRQVVGKLHWKTWENIQVNREVDGLVTLHCENTPLDLVLQRIGEQVSARTRVLYPVYGSGASKKRFVSLVTGTDAQATGWTNFESAESNLMLARFRDRTAAKAAASDAPDAAPAAPNDGAGPGGPGGPGGPDGGGPGMGQRQILASNARLDLNLAVVPIQEASVEVAKRSSVMIIPEDGLLGSVTLKSAGITVDQAAKKMANQLHRATAKLYLLDAQRRPAMTAEVRDQLAGMNTGERPTREQMQARREARANDPGAQDRVMERTIRMAMTTTPEQRAAQRSRMMKAFASRTAGGPAGPGGPGGPGGGMPGGPAGGGPTPSN